MNFQKAKNLTPKGEKSNLSLTTQKLSSESRFKTAEREVNQRC